MDDALLLDLLGMDDALLLDLRRFLADDTHVKFPGYFHLFVKTLDINSLDLATGRRSLFILRTRIMLL